MSVAANHVETRGRFVRGLKATALSPLVTVAIQLGTVPVLLHFWGANKYGEWLLLSAVPSYLTLSDVGLGDASGSDMTARVAAGDRKSALETFQSSWAILSAVSIFLGLIALSTVWFVPWERLLNLSVISRGQAAVIILILGTWVLLGQQSGILESGFRCDGNYALGTLLGTMIRLLEALTATLVGALTGRLVDVAAAYLLCRIVCTFGYALLLRRVSPWLRLGVGHVRLSVATRLIRPAVGFVAFPAAQAVSLQGFTILIGALLGPVAVTAFATLRTLSRFVFQIGCTLGWAAWPELSSAFGSGDLSSARMLHRHAWNTGIRLSLLGTLLLWILGPYAYLRWTRHAVAFDGNCFHILLVASLIGSIWYISSVVPMSANLHLSIALSFLAAALMSVGVARVLTPRYGLSGAALSLLLVDVSMCWIAFRAALGQTRDNVRDFLAATLLSGSSERFEPTYIAAPVHD